MCALKSPMSQVLSNSSLCFLAQSVWAADPMHRCPPMHRWIPSIGTVIKIDL